MKVLVDSHVILWWLASPKLLKAEALATLELTENEIFISAASWWELAIKRALKRLQFDPRALGKFLDRGQVQRLPITCDHAEAAGSLPRHHGDPFDRMLAAQARLEGLVLMTRDEVFELYDIPLFRA